MTRRVLVDMAMMPGSCAVAPAYPRDTVSGVALFAVIYDYSAPEAQLDLVRPEHGRYLRSREELVLSGPWVGGSRGALLIFRAEDAAAVEKIVASDPIVRGGHVGQHTIREWNPVNGPMQAHL
jgi:uncharacterized protein YciI